MVKVTMRWKDKRARLQETMAYHEAGHVLIACEFGRKMCLAYHEAGHAVIARVLGIEVRLATIRPDKFSAGHVTHGASWPDREDANGTIAAEDREEEWQQRMEMAEDRAKLEIAGGFSPISEVLVPGKPLQQTNGEVSRLWELLQADTADLVELHWLSIERVAEALLIHEELGQEEIEALVY